MADFNEKIEDTSSQESREVQLNDFALSAANAARQDNMSVGMIDFDYLMVHALSIEADLGMLADDDDLVKRCRDKYAGLFSKASSSSSTPVALVVERSDDEPDDPQEKITDINVWYSQSTTTAAARQVWNALATTGMPVGDIIQQLVVIRSALGNQILNTSIAEPGYMLSPMSCAAHVSKANVPTVLCGDYALSLVLEKVKSCRLEVEESVVRMTKGSATLKITPEKMEFSGNSKQFLHGLEVGGKQVEYQGRDGSLTATRLVLLCYDLKYTEKKWGLSLATANTSSMVAAIRKSLFNMRLHAEVVKALSQVPNNPVLAAAALEQCLIAGADSYAEKFFKPLSYELQLAEKELTTIKGHPYSRTIAGAKEAFALHARGEKIRNDLVKVEVTSNNASAFTAGPGFLKRTNEVHEVLSLMQRIAVVDDLPRDIEVVPDSLSAGDWLALSPAKGFHVANLDVEGKIGPLARNCSDKIVIQQAILPDSPFKPLEQFGQMALPAAYVVRVKGSAVDPDALTSYVEKMPEHWKSVRLVKVGNLHNPQFYLILSRTSDLQRRRPGPQLVEIGDYSARVGPANPEGKSTPRNVMALVVKNGYIAVAHVAAVAELLTQAAYNRGRRPTVAEMRFAIPHYPSHVFTSGAGYEIDRGTVAHFAALNTDADLQEALDAPF